MIKRFVTVEARPSADVVFEGMKPTGYFQTFGVTAESEQEMTKMISDYLKNDLGSTFVEIAESWDPDLEGHDSDIRELCGDTRNAGIWYHTGRAWFPSDSEDL